MIDYKHSELFQNGSVDKQWKISYSGGFITNKNLSAQSIEISESLCSEPELRFGCCESSVIKFKMGNVINSLLGKWLTISVVLNHQEADPFFVGKYKVVSDKFTADRQWREITAYDALYDVLNLDAAEWYETLFGESDNPITMRSFRKSFMNFAGLKEALPGITLANDDMSVEKTINPEHISGKDVLTRICEINGCFGHIGREGMFYFIYLPQDTGGLYPSKTLFPNHAPNYLKQSETGRLYPQAPKSYRIGKSSYIECHGEDFITKKITKLQIRQEENDIGVIYGDGNNCYIIQDNFLVYGKNPEELKEIAKNIYDKITDIIYRPFDVDAIGNPCLEVGDPIRIPTKYFLVESYILKRTLKGVQALRDSYSAEGIEEYSEKVNSVQNSIVQLKGKTNELVRTVEETKSTIKNVEEGLQTQIKQTSEAIEAEASARNELGEEIKASLSLKIDNNDDGTIISLINGSADKIHFGANNMFTVSSPNFTITEQGDVRIMGNITANENISLRWKDTSTLPVTNHDYVFVETQYNKNLDDGGMHLSVEPYLVIKSPFGTEIMVVGNTSVSENPLKPKIKDTPYFPNGAVIENAYIKSLNQFYGTFEVGNKVGLNANWASIKVRKSGAFVSVYGTYYTSSHKSGESKEFSIETTNESFFPVNAHVKTVGNAGKRIFIFVITKEGNFIARNMGETDVNSNLGSGTETSINFRFDYFQF